MPRPSCATWKTSAATWWTGPGRRGKGSPPVPPSETAVLRIPVSLLIPTWRAISVSTSRQPSSPSWPLKRRARSTEDLCHTPILAILQAGHTSPDKTKDNRPPRTVSKACYIIWISELGRPSPLIVECSPSSPWAGLVLCVRTGGGG